MFDLKKHNTTTLIEINAGLTTFFSMVYILVVNPAILSQVNPVDGLGMSFDALFTATALGAIAATVIMALLANLPFAVAPGMGMNAFFAFVVVNAMGYTWPQALTAVLISGTIFFFLSLSPIRQKVLDEVPKALQYAICTGVGLMISYIGLLNGGAISLANKVPELADISHGPGLLVIIGLGVIGILLALKFRFAILASIIITTLIGIPLGVTNTDILSKEILSYPHDLSPLAFKFDFSVLGSLAFWMVIISFLFLEMVDSLGGFLGLFGVMGKEGERYKSKMGRAFIADSLGVVIGSCFGLSPNTAYCESGAGVASGGRTGLTALVVAICFALSLFAAPLFSIIPASAISPSLVVVGLLMLSSVNKINFQDATEAFPSIVVIVIITLTWRITDGLSIGWILYIILKIAAGKTNELNLTVWIVGIIFALKMIISL